MPAVPSRQLWSSAARVAALLLLSALPFAPLPAFALSEIPEEDVPPVPEITTVPLPPPIPNPGNPARQPSRDAETPSPDTDEEPETAEEPPSEPTPIPEIQYDLSLLPEPVRTLRERIVETCKSGDIEALRPLLSLGEEGTLLSFGGVDGDPIQFLKELSGDGEGHEILAILEEVLEAGYVHLEPGTEGEIYVWPYFFSVPLDSLTPPQRVELFRLVTAGDYEDMKTYGAYIFYRVGITPEGKWAFFVAGD
jgi:hypothetical protein